MSNPQIELARRYVEQTSVSLFLTGKAGTGKTTFLHDLAAHCPKRHVVVAPTGVAAVNAGGVTIHSFFQLPFDPYLPDVKELVTEYQLPESRKSLSRQKLNIIRTLELLIIDEISMVRADLLDAIDMTLRRHRRSQRPFGGVQLLMIGDVHQLPPVVTDAERPYLSRVYPSPFFFNSKALQRTPYVTIELTTVYRQQDAAFVDLLNHVRDNRIDADTLRCLNGRVGEPAQGAITLTTHNHQADAINRHHMQALQGEQRSFEAKVTGSFADSAMPADKVLDVKVGERVMFLKNDSSGAHRYFNGKLATVTGFGDDTIEVVDDDGDTIHAGRELWENYRYSIDPSNNQIRQEVDGTFCQYPLRAAWAVTIHKAQGLTFDRVAIDAADAFAFGQVYVALSRCRTLEGLTLTSPLSPAVAFADADVERFVASCPTFDQAQALAEGHERQYRLERLMDLFGMEAIVADADRLMDLYASRLRNLFPKQVAALRALVGQLYDLASVAERFRRQLAALDEPSQDERAAKGAAYYASVLAPIVAALGAITEVEVDNKENARLVDEAAQALADRLGLKLACIEAVKRSGYSVAVVQRATADHLIGTPRRKAASKAPKDEPQRPGDAHAPLVVLLKQWRKQRAEAEGLPPYVVLQQKALLAIATNLPTDPAALKRQLGVGAKTVERYGAEILALVADYRESQGIAGTIQSAEKQP